MTWTLDVQRIGNGPEIRRIVRIGDGCKTSQKEDGVVAMKRGNVKERWVVGMRENRMGVERGTCGRESGPWVACRWVGVMPGYRVKV